MDLTTRYLGFELPHPFMAGASPMVDDLDQVRALEDAGAAAIAMHSLFEEQLAGEQIATYHSMEDTSHMFGEAMTFMPDPPDFRLGPDEYLEQLRRIKETVALPLFASLNGTTLGGWLEYAKLMADAGADALELNLYQVVTDPSRSAAQVEGDNLEIVRTVIDAVGIPVAVKLSPAYTSLPNFAAALEDVGAAGLVLFNRFYQPDIDIEELEMQRRLDLSTSADLLLRINWLGILSSQVSLPLAVSGGIHTGIDAVKAVMAGASAVQMVSALLTRGPQHLAQVREDFTAWLIEHEYESLEQMCGSMNLARCPDPAAFERLNYVRLLMGWTPS
jgi:dihydroorotate dehydrogenase (fumarate)